MGRARLFLLVIVILLVGVLAFSTAILDDHYILLSLTFLVIAMVPFFLRLEIRNIETRELVLIAVLAAVAAIGRVPFAPLPSVQPTSFVIIVSAVVFGSETGFLIGAIAALVSNIFLGQGPWTPWQMFCWGMIGATAGWLRNTWWMKKRLGLLSFGFIWGFLFGWIMNIWFLISLPDALSWSLIALAYIKSFYFDLAHAVCNVFFLAVFGGSWIKILKRFGKKYGLLGRQSMKN
ncbi:ECF transporter S component [Bacillus sp. EAC]|uniref:ECF transporter S component n=1 Tax=Bacillus sp. EAC TaxID=1978338 RepID=UPI000B4481F7|nr:ECF transporter S component [Bacillus sp. EAC]